MSTFLEAGYTLKESCLFAGMSRSRYYEIQRPGKAGKEVIGDNSGDYAVLEMIREIKKKHPFWGYRRVCAWLVHRENVLINRKKVYRLMKEHDLLMKGKAYKAKRTPDRSKPKADHPRQFWGIDMTKFMINSVSWVYLVIVLDWYSKKIVGWDLSLRTKTEDWKRALDMALNSEFPGGVRGCGLKLVSDNGCQPTSVSFMKDMAHLEIEQIFTSYNNPKGNADTERVMRTLKEELLWLNEFESFEEARNALENWITVDYNRNYVHSALGYMSPVEFENAYFCKASSKAA